MGGVMVGESKIFGDIMEDPKERHKNGFNLEENVHLVETQIHDLEA